MTRGGSTTRPGGWTSATWISGGWSYFFNIIKELFWRGIGVLDLIGSLFGILWPKKMRIQVKILRDVDGKALFGARGASAG